MTDLICRRELLDLLVEYGFNTFAHLRNSMVWTIAINSALDPNRRYYIPSLLDVSPGVSPDMSHD